MSLPDRATYEQACALFGVAPKSDEQLVQLAAFFGGPDFLPEAWEALGQEVRVSFRLDSIYYFTLKDWLADEAWEKEHPELRHTAPPTGGA